MGISSANNGFTINKPKKAAFELKEGMLVDCKRQWPIKIVHVGPNMVTTRCSFQLMVSGVYNKQEMLNNIAHGVWTVVNDPETTTKTAPVVEEVSKACRCDLRDIMMIGCKCGGE